MGQHTVLNHDKWLEARKALLQKEKEFTRMHDEMGRMRRALPWEKVEKDYIFETTDGPKSLADLFDGRSQLIVYHFMYGPDWEEGCKSCSFVADHFDPAIVHLNHRDVTMIAASNAPLEKLQAFKNRMGWSFDWVSSMNNDFNQDYYVTFTPEQNENEKAYFNYRYRKFASTEAPGASVFFKDENGDVFHTYSVYERGLDDYITAYRYLDIVPKGRDEDDLPYTMSWLRLRDSYQD